MQSKPSHLNEPRRSFSNYEMFYFYLKLLSLKTSLNIRNVVYMFKL